jgi:hypothetical protein
VRTFRRSQRSLGLCPGCRRDWPSRCACRGKVTRKNSLFHRTSPTPLRRGRRPSSSDTRAGALARFGLIDRSVACRLQVIMLQAEILPVVETLASPSLILYPLAARVKKPVATHGSGFFEIKSRNDRRSKENGQILLAKSRRGSFSRKLGEIGRAGEANPCLPGARDEFANSIRPFCLLLRRFGRLIAKSPLPNIPTGFLTRAVGGGA